MTYEKALIQVGPHKRKKGVLNQMLNGGRLNRISNIKVSSFYIVHLIIS